MTHDQLKAVLDDYVDGDLDAATQQAVAAHLETCEGCRQEVQALQALAADLRALPKEKAPPAGLWREIERRTAGQAGTAIDLGEVRARRSAGASGWLTGWRLAAAAVLLVAFSSAVTLYVSGRLEGDRLAADVGTPSTSLRAQAIPVNVAGTYSATIDALRRTLETRRADLSPETVREIERNLDVIDRAIASSQEALAEDPGDRELIRTVSAMYEEKIALLQDATDLPEGS